MKYSVEKLLCIDEKGMIKTSRKFFSYKLDQIVSHNRFTNTPSETNNILFAKYIPSQFSVKINKSRMNYPLKNDESWNRHSIWTHCCDSSALIIFFFSPRYYSNYAQSPITCHHTLQITLAPLVCISVTVYGGRSPLSTMSRVFVPLNCYYQWFSR